MYEENKTGSVLKDILLQVILVVIFVFLLLWLFPTKWDVNKKLKDGFDPLYQQLFTDHITTMKESAQSYYTKERLPKKVGDKVSMTLGEMLDKKLLTSFVDSNNKQCSLTGSYVEITKMDKEYMMKVNLNCSDKSDYIITYLGCYNYCEDALCEKKDDNKQTSNNNNSGKKDDNKPTPVVKKYEYEYELITNGKYGDWSNWSQWSTNYVSSNNYRQVKVTTKEEVVDRVSVGTVPVYTPAIATTKTTTTSVSKKLKCPSGYKPYNTGNKNSKICAAKPTQTASTTTMVTNTTQVDAIATTVKVCPDGSITQNGYCFANSTVSDTKLASHDTTYSDWVYVGRETYTTIRTSSNTKKYTLVSSKDSLDCTNTCKKVTKNTYDIYQRSANTTYNCNSYHGYQLQGNKCIKTITDKVSVAGTWHEETRYSCADGSTPVNGKCTVTTTTPTTVSGTTKCKYGSYDSFSGLCLYRGEFDYNCAGTVKDRKCVVETTVYTCKTGTKVGSQCKTTETIYEDVYGKVTYYKYRTREYISGTRSVKWSSSDNDKNLLNQGYTLTGNKVKVK